ncbi:ABC transporter permease [Saccharibacillus kuerlensis]|uniref:ABC3 transporter permease C-terminal domain-containing protein n=1 Tax=Saccharibacillus kuerlensis TaxID=459527 RepID=A0ABQ2KXZ6_9BACL|nr:FtsX-like permease family protein [Saccharibacillus kuerlensis]GGN94037.1 hypothetical protein GCM10010969_08380 [Saccharibacillus kuerlensis]
MFFIKKSLYLIVYYIVVATFTCLAFSSLLTSYANTKVLQNGLSDNSLQFVINTGTAGAVSDLTNEQLIKQLEKNTDSFLLYKDEDNFFAKSVYLHNAELPFPMDSGQSLDTFQPNSIVLDRSLMNNTTVRDGKYYFSYQGRSYEVLDSFAWINKYMYRDSNLFVSLNLEKPAFGSYSIDGISESNLESLLSLWTAERPEAFSFSITPAVSGFMDRFVLTMRDQAFIIMVFGVALLLMMLSTLGTTLSWVQAKKDEIQARHLVGANAGQIRFWLLKEYWIVLLLSFFIGNGLAWLIAKWGVFHELIREVTLFGSLISFLFCLAIGTLTALISTSRYDKRKRIRKKVVLP